MDINVSSLLIGILVMLSAYLAISRAVDVSNTSVKKSLAIFTAALGLLATLWLRHNPALLWIYSEKIVLAGLGIVLALLAFARKSLK